MNLDNSGFTSVALCSCSMIDLPLSMTRSLSVSQLHGLQVSNRTIRFRRDVGIQLSEFEKEISKSSGWEVGLGMVMVNVSSQLCTGCTYSCDERVKIRS